MKNIKKLTALFSALYLMGYIAVYADSPYREHRFNSFSTLPECVDGDILFVGNSITNMMNWWEAFGSRANIKARGNSGATSTELLEYYDDIVKGKPSKIFLMIGTNDLGMQGETNSPDSVADRIEQLLAKFRSQAPQAEIYYQSILPSTVGSRTPEKTEKTNSLVKEWIKGRGDNKMTYVDLYTPMVDSSGAMKGTVNSPTADALSFDGLHITQKGYQIWLDIIKDYVGYEPVYGKNADNLAGGMNRSNGMRVSYFGALPVYSNDILMIGDEMIHNGEWQERLHRTDIKDRGIGWGFPSISIEQSEGTFDAILNGNRDKGVVKETPKAVVFVGGTGEIKAGKSADETFDSYRAAVNTLREKLPDTPIYVMTLLPFGGRDNEHNRDIADLNGRIVTELVNPENNIFLINVYDAVGGQNRNEDYFMGENNPFLSGKGYEKVAQTIGRSLPK